MALWASCSGVERAGAPSRGLGEPGRSAASRDTVSFHLMKYRVLIVLLGVCAVTGASASSPVVTAPLQLSYASQEQLLEDALTAPCKNDDRLEAARDLFLRAGAPAEAVEVVDAGRYKNIVVTIPGSGPGTIVVGAHYDKTSEGCGAIDNWAGVTMVAHLYKTLRQLRPQRTFVFVAFGGEEAGLKGSRAFVDNIAKAERTSYCAMINFDSFGLGQPQIIEEISSPKLTTFVGKVAQESKVPFSAARLGIGDSDSTSFKRGGIPAVTLHGLSNEWDKIIHTGNDQASRIRSASLYLGYILGINVLARLDGCDCAEFR